jgi:hypothetical protein
MTSSHLESIREFDPASHAPESIAATKQTCTWHTDVDGPKPRAVKSLRFAWDTGSRREAVCADCFSQMKRNYPTT